MTTPQKIASSVYQVSGAVNVFFIDDPENGIIVIDTGFPATIQKILAAVQAVGRQPADVRHILITHADMDHIGGLGRLADATGAQVYTGIETKRYIEKRIAPPHLPVFTKPFLWLMSRIMLKPVTVHHVVAGGQTLPLAGGIRVISAPGHTPDNLNFYYERERVLFAADLLNARGGTLALTPPAITWNTDAAKQSAKAVLALEPAFICVGHGHFVDVAKSPEQVENLRQTL